MNWGNYFETFLSFLRATWKYRWFGLITSWMTAIIGWTLISFLPNHYQADASVYIDTDSLMTPLLKDLALTHNANERIQKSVRTLLTRPNLDKIAKMSDLDLGISSRLEHERILDKLEYDIKIDREGRSNLYNIVYEHTNPETAKLVVESILNVLIEATLSDKRIDTSLTKKFLNEQISHYENKLINAEERLAEFKRKNIGTLPKEEKTYYQSLDKILDDKDKTMTRLFVAQSRKNELERQLKGESPTIGIMDSSLENEHSLLIRHPGNRQYLEEQLHRLELKYTKAHPSVKKVTHLLAQLSDNLKGLNDLSQHSIQDLDQNPVYQQMKIALSETNTEIAEIEAQLNKLSESESQLQLKMDKVIQAETILANLNRDYSIDKNHYQALLAKRESAEMAESLENSSGTINFRVVDPPYVPSKPSGPNRLLFSFIVFIMSILSGIFTSFLASQIRPAFYDSLAVTRELNLKILASVPKIKKHNSSKFKQFAHTGLFSIGCIMLIVCCTFHNTFFYN